MKPKERSDKGRESITVYTKMWLGMTRSLRAQGFDVIELQPKGLVGFKQSF